MQEQNQISTNNLSIGLKVKNYKEMCKLLQQPIVAGKSKQLQVKNWERYFSYNKLGQQFIITEIYDEPLEPEYRKYQRGIYIQYVEIILRTLLSTKEEEYYDVTKQQLWRDLGMVNQKYKRIALPVLNKELNEYTVTKSEMEAFYRKCDSRLSEILKTSLNNLMSRRIIEYVEQKIIVVSSSDKEKQIEHIVADDKMLRQVLDVERTTLDQMHLKDMEEVRKSLKYKDFYILRNKIAFEKYEWLAILDSYHIIFNKELILKNIAADENELKEKMLEFNEKIVDAINRSNEAMINNQHKKAAEQYNNILKNKNDNMSFGSIPNSHYSYKDLNIFDYNEDFLPKTKELSKHLISIKEVNTGNYIDEQKIDTTHS